MWLKPQFLTKLESYNEEYGVMACFFASPEQVDFLKCWYNLVFLFILLIILKKKAEVYKIPSLLISSYN